jgi:hypothetical protein
MNTPLITKLGHLSIDVNSESMHFAYHVPIEIRDSSMRLVRRAERDRQFELEAGLYQVSAVLEDGREHTRLVEVKVGEHAKVELGKEQKAPHSRKTYRASVTDTPRYQSPRYTQKIEAIDDAEAAANVPGVEVQVLELHGAELKRETRTLWIFGAAPGITAVPTALIKVGERVNAISLPASPEGGPTKNLCALRVDDSPSGAHATAWISPERTVANALQNMLASGQISSAARMAGEATELLRGKYDDPTGAALGALILHKVGRLGRLQSWVENLARDFAWLPDGKILLAAMLMDRRENLDKALQYAMEASQLRPLYTESFSILLDLLRRWPREADRSIRYEAMTGIARRSPYVDGDSICLSNRIED